MLNVFYSTLFLTFNVLTYYRSPDYYQHVVFTNSQLFPEVLHSWCNISGWSWTWKYSPLAKKSQFPLALEYMLIKFNGAKIKSVRSLPISDRICTRCKGVTRVEWRGRVPLLRYQETMQTFASQGFSFRSIAINGTEWTKNLG